MAVIKPTITNSVNGDDSVITAQWVLSNGDTGAPISKASYADRSVQVTGTFGAGGNMRWEGSNATIYATLTDPQGNALDFTAAKIEAVTELCLISRPSVTAGDGTTALTVTLIARRATPMRT